MAEAELHSVHTVLQAPTPAFFSFPLFASLSLVPRLPPALRRAVTFGGAWAPFLIVTPPHYFLLPSSPRLPGNLRSMSERGSFRGGRGGGRGGAGRGGGKAGAQNSQAEKPKKENILDLTKYMDKEISVKFNGGREGKLF